MKKFCFTVITVMLIIANLFIFSACTNNDINDDNNGSTNNIKISVAAPDGAPALALAELISGDKTVVGADITYNIVMSDGATEAASIIGQKIVTGDYDMAILPTNVAATLYNKNAPIKIVSVNTWGNLYIVSKKAPITDLNALKGQVVYVVSQSGPPMAVIKHLLSVAGIDIASDDEVTQSETNGIYNGVDGKVVIKYMAATTMIPYLKTGKIAYGLLGEPAVTNAINAINANGGTDGKVVFDLQEAWKTAAGTSSYPQASLVVRTDFLMKNKAVIDNFVTALGTVDEWTVEEGNLDKAKKAIQTIAENTSLSKMTLDTFSRCRINCKTTAESKTEIKNYLAVFGITVDDDFYYVG